MIKKKISIHAYINYLLIRLVNQSELNNIVNMYFLENKWNWLLGYYVKGDINYKLESFYNEFLKYHQVYGHSYQNTELFFDILNFVYNINFYMLQKQLSSSFLYENIENLQEIKLFKVIQFFKYSNDYIIAKLYEQKSSQRNLTVYLYIHYLLQNLTPHYKLPPGENIYIFCNEWTRLVFDYSFFKDNKTVVEELQYFLQEFMFHYNEYNDLTLSGDIYYDVCLYIFSIKIYISKNDLDKSFFTWHYSKLKDVEYFKTIDFFKYEAGFIEYYS